MYVTAQTLITAGALLSAAAGFITIGWKLFKWINHQKEQDGEIVKLREEISEVREMHKRDQCGIQEEQTLVVYGLLACLKGLAEQGCDGPVKEAIKRIEKHINQKAHGQE